VFSRLETVSKDLSLQIEAASIDQQMKASLVACELALQAAHISIPIVEVSLMRLQQKQRLSQEQIAELSRLSEQLDEKYFAAQERSETNTALRTEALQLFKQARAVSALSFAGGEINSVAARESIYEASMVFDNREEFFSKVEGAISK